MSIELRNRVEKLEMIIEGQRRINVALEARIAALESPPPAFLKPKQEPQPLKRS